MSYNNKDNKYYGYIYIIYNTINDKVYIGQTRRTIDIRWKQHLISVNREADNTVLYKAMKKYGTSNFFIKQIAEYSHKNVNELIKILNENEIMYISQYNSVIPNGYNMQFGGKSPTESLKRPVNKYSLDGELLGTYESLSAACAESDGALNHVHISECCRGILYTSGGYIWRYLGDDFNKYSKNDKRFVPIDQYSKDGNFIKSFTSFSDAIYEVFNDKNHKKYSSHITSCCKGNRKTAYGYVWRYANEPFDKY